MTASPILVLSVPGTGTRFITKLLQDVFRYEAINMGWMANDPLRPATTVHMHAQPCDGEDICSKVFQRPEIKVIIPLRKPVASYTTYRWRNRTRSTPQSEIDAVDMITMRWKNLIELALQKDRIFIPVEEELDHTKLLHLIGKFTDTEWYDDEAFYRFAKDWPKVGHEPGKKSREDDDYSFLDFALYYYETWVQETRRLIHD